MGVAGSINAFVDTAIGRFLTAHQVLLVTHYQDASILADVSKDLDEPMVGRNVSQMPEAEKIAGRGW